MIVCIFVMEASDQTTMYSLVAYYDIADWYLQVRAESPMEHPAQGKRSDTLGLPCWSSRALKGQKHYNVL